MKKTKAMSNKYHDRLWIKGLIYLFMFFVIVCLIAGFWNPWQWALAVLFSFMVAIGIVELKNLNK